MSTRGGRRRLGLDRSNFRVLDDGVEEEIMTFSDGDVPFTAMVLLDASGSMVGEPLGLALEGARAFVSGMEEFDEAKIVAFADAVRAEKRIAESRSVLERALVEHPAERQLWLALAASAVTGTALQERVRKALEQPLTATGPSPRLRFDAPRTEPIAEVERRYHDLTSGARAALR